MLSALVESNGGEIIDLGVTPDEPAAIRERLQYAVTQSVNLILTSAGVSVGSRDYIRPVVEEQGQITFWRVNMRPGKPVAFGHYMKIPLVGLPGNPVSAFVSFLILVLPALRKLSGSSNFESVLQKAILNHPVESDGRESYLRAELDLKDGKYFASLTGHQGSGNLFALVQAKALLILPSGVKSLPSGSEVNFVLLNSVLDD
jgi:molybdopterin molybdotransferase